jgi:hypothetical protein
MATTTTNFGWDIPQSTDLVKDGATAIAALGQDIDTALVDLKGGTTGQILAKASNTDLDYSWITNDVGDITAVTAGTGISGGGTTGAVTITNSMATAIDAKGDLIAGTAADTFSRLAVGGDYGFLQALASESTGLKWNDGAWTTYTPTVTAQSGTFTTVSATGRYIRIGKLCIVNVSITVTNNGTAAVQTFATAPFAASSSQIYSGCGRENAVQGWMLQSRITTDSTIRIGKYDGSYGSGTGYQLDTTTIYEVA